jgi:capsular polysaccharide biosynthesis protein
LLVPDGLRPVEAFFLEKLLPPNIIVRTVEGGALYMPDTLLVPSFLSRQMSGCLPKAWLQFFGERVFPRRKRNKHRRIHITRRASRAGRRILNEEQLTTALARHGFESFDLQSLPLQAQIDLFFDAEVVIGAHGAGLTNLVFADQARVIEMHPTSRVFPHYYFLSLALGHRHSFYCGDATHRNDDFLVDVPAVERLILEDHQRAFA